MSSLSYSAELFIPGVKPHLYPAGMDKFGREIITIEDSPMHLDYYEAATEMIDVVPPVTPAIDNVQLLRPWKVKLPDGQDFC